MLRAEVAEGRVGQQGSGDGAWGCEVGDWRGVGEPGLAGCVEDWEGGSLGVLAGRGMEGRLRVEKTRKRKEIV